MGTDCTNKWPFVTSLKALHKNFLKITSIAHITAKEKMATTGTTGVPDISELWLKAPRWDHLDPLDTIFHSNLRKMAAVSQ